MASASPDRLLERARDACLAAALTPASTFSGSSLSSVATGSKISHTAPSGGSVTLAEAPYPCEGTACATTWPRLPIFPVPS